MARRKQTAAGGVKRAALYVRVSSDDQAERGTSLESQRADLRKHAEEQGWVVTKVYEDAGISGSMDADKRPGLAELSTAVRAGAVEIVLVAAWDRLARDLYVQMGLWREWDKLGVDYYSLAEPESSGEGGAFRRQIMGAVAEEERRKIRERTARGRAAVVAAGGWGGGLITPYGFEAVPNPNRDRGSVLAVDKAEAAVVRRMVTLLVDKGLTTGEAAATLNAEGKLPRRAPRWTNTLVRNIVVKNIDVWGGRWVYGKGGSFHDEIEVRLPEQILSARRVEALRLAMNAATGKSPVNARMVHPLSGRIICPECGRTFTGLARADRAVRRYVCSDHTGTKSGSKETRCKTPRLPAAELDRAVWEHLRPYLDDPAAMLAAAAERAEEQESLPEAIALVEKCQKELAEVVTRGIKLGLDDGTITHMKRTAQDDLDAALRHKAAVESSLAVAANASTALADAARLAERMRGKLDDPSPETMKKVFGLCDVQVTIESFAPFVWHATANVMVDEVADAVNPQVSERHATEVVTCRRTTSSPRASGW